LFYLKAGPSVRGRP